LLAILPMAANGQCLCTPADQDVLASTTAITFPARNRTINFTLPEVCVVRLLISATLRADVNLDHIIDNADVEMIQNDPAYILDPDAPSNCTGPCGRADVNGDGRVNQLDTTSVTQSAVLGTNVTCGGIYATDFSCGSSRSAPLNPAIQISFDNLQYFEFEGINVPGTPLINELVTKRTAGTFDVVFDKLAAVEEKTAVLEQEFKQAEVALRQADVEIKDQMATKKHVESRTHSVLFDVAVSVGAVVVCACIALVVQKKKF